MLRPFLPLILAFAVACAGTTALAYIRGRGAAETAPSATSIHDAKAPVDSAAPDDAHDIPADTLHPQAVTSSIAPTLAKPDSIKTSHDSTRTAGTAEPGRSTEGSKPTSADTPPVTSAPSPQLDEGRLTKVFGAMNARDAARVLEQMADADVVEILAGMTDRRAGEILALLQVTRAATLAKALRNHSRKST